MFAQLISTLKKSPKTIVFTEGTDPRILEASARLLSGTFLTPVLVGNADEITKAAEEAGFNIRGAEIMDPANFADMDKMVALMVELRKGKMTEEQCRKSLSQANYFGTMLVKMGYADALLGGATYSTADTVRPALQIIKTKPGSKIVSSCFIMVRPSATGENEVLAMADCAINIKPTEDELVEIAVETARTAKVFGIDPKVAFLSYSTLGSGKGEDVDKRQGRSFFVIYFAFYGDGFVRFLPLYDEILFPFDAKEGFAGQYKVDGFAFRLFADADGHPITFCSVVGEEDVFSSCLFQLLQCFGQAFVL